MEGVSSAFKKVMESEEKNKKCYKYKPPDGGWGWIIVISFAIQNMILLPVIINFGLMFRGVFAKLKMTTTDSSIIINCNSASGLLFGLLNGPLLKTFGFRKIACIGALLTFFGNSMTSFATTPIEFIVYYGIISSIGVALVMASFSLALNTYFVERRGIATGVAMSFTGLGPVFMPLLISKLMAEYGGRGTALIMAGLTLHSFVGALLLQPVKWHRHRVEESDPNNVENGVKDNDQEMTDIENGKKKLFENSLAVNNDSLVKRRFSDITPLRGVSEKGGSVHSLNVSVNEANKVSANGVINEVKNVTDNPVVEENDPLKIKYNVYKVNENDKSETIAFLQSDNDGDSKYHEKEQTSKSKSNNVVNKKKSWRRNIIEIFDLDLLNEPVFRSIWIGMSIAFTAEMNFTLMTPFILGDMGYNTQQTAKMMSIMGISDILSRLICPFIGSKTKLPARFLYIVSLCILVTFRFCLTVVESDWTALFVFIGLGLGKGFLSVYRALVVPNHVPLEKLASASGLQTVLNGIFLMSFGPILGHIKDKLGNYDWYIYVLNILTLITITMWVIEFTIRILRQRKSGR